MELLRRLTPVLALTFRSIIARRDGEHADGDLSRRGCRAARAGGRHRPRRAETVRAVLWYSDLEGFTRIADEEPAAELIALLNDYAEAVVDSVHAHGGQVLKFIGDGILAMFPLADEGMPCARALDAAVGALAAARPPQRRARAAERRPTTGMHVALHVGDVLYGNIGSRDRLDFTVVGPAVNEVARIEALCRSLEQQVIVSAAFAEARARRRAAGLARPLRAEGRAAAGGAVHGRRRRLTVVILPSKPCPALQRAELVSGQPRRRGGSDMFRPRMAATSPSSSRAGFAPPGSR